MYGILAQLLQYLYENVYKNQSIYQAGAGTWYVPVIKNMAKNLKTAQMPPPRKKTYQQT
jgi:hypothetical protein